MLSQEKQESRLTAKKLVLHVGCGQYNPNKLHAAFRGEEWTEVRLDIDEGVRPDVVATMTDMPMVEPESVDAVWSSHNLEHLHAHEVPIALGEFYRVLKPGGFALMTLPDLQQVAALVAQGKLEDVASTSPAGPIAAIDMIYGHRASIARGNTFMAHKTGFTARTLGLVLRKAGFVRVRVRQGKSFDLWAVAHKPSEAGPSRPS